MHFCILLTKHQGLSFLRTTEEILSKVNVHFNVHVVFWLIHMNYYNAICMFLYNMCKGMVSQKYIYIINAYKNISPSGHMFVSSSEHHEEI